MAINPADLADLARRFEPILHFHKRERFFPSDAKRYMEACALWFGASDNKATWGSGAPGLPRSPPVKRGGIAARKGEPGLFLGDQPTLLSNTFLDLAGWTDGELVTVDSKNRYAHVDRIAKIYNQPKTNTEKKLNQSRFWYHAEIFDASRLRSLTSRANLDTPPGYEPPSRKVLTGLTDPALLCYYLFFPACDDPLEGCETDFLGKQFGNFAGDWVCVAVLLEGSGNQTNYKPKFIGLTSRNPGSVQFLGDSMRKGMPVFNWKDARPEIRVRAPGLELGEHPRIFVARGNHGLYLTPGDHLAAPFSPDDISRKYCGSRETLDQELLDWPKPGSSHKYKWWEYVLFFVPVVGPFILFGLHGEFGIGLDVVGTGIKPAPPQIDHAPNPGMFGKVIHPQGLNPPDINPDAEKIPWPKMTDEKNLTSVIDGRLYSLLVDRRDADPTKRQIWWPKESKTAPNPGFNGRWGPFVTRDPKDRRSGMAFPEYWHMFLLALAKKLSV